MTDIKKIISEAKIDLQFQDKKLLQPLKYHRQTPGKNVRHLWMQAFNQWLQVPTDVFKAIGEVTDLTFDACLLIDDVEDNSLLRRGLPAAHVVYGAPTVINTSSYIFFLALEKTAKLGHPEAVNVYLDEIMKLHRGQGLDLYWRDNFICPTEEEYYEMVKQKTNSLLPIRLMQLFSEAKHDYSELCVMFSVYFQIRDDYCNLVDESYADKKTYCEDLTEGKFSFPVIHAIRSHPDEDSQIKQILRMHTTDMAMKKHCVSLIEKCGSFKHTLKILTQLDKALRADIEALGGNPMLEMLLDKLRTCDCSCTWVYLHNSREYPDVTSGGLVESLVPMQREAFLQVEPITVSAVDMLRSYSIHKYYSFSDCLSVWKMKSILALCECVPFYMSTSTKLPHSRQLCTVADIPCLNKFKENFVNRKSPI